MFPPYARCTAQEPTVSPLCAACPCERELNFGHLAARCTTTSPGPLRRDSSLLRESTPSHHAGDSTRRTLFEHSSSLFFCRSPCQAAGHFELPRGVFPSDRGWARASKKEGRFSFLDVMPSSHTPFGPWRKTSSKEKDPGAQIAPRLTRKMRFQWIFAMWKVFFCCCFCLWQSQKYGNSDAFGVWRGLRIDLGSRSTVFLKT